jgi:hypothetical protein
MSSDRRASPNRHQELLVVLEPENGVEDDARERLARQLGAELRELDIDSLTAVERHPAPAGSKGVDVSMVGSWLVTLTASGDVFKTIVATVQDWLSRHRSGHAVKIVMDGDTLELTAASTAEQAEIVRAFVLKHAQA